MDHILNVFIILGMAPGKYSFDFIYKKRRINTIFILEIEQWKSIDHSQLYGKLNIKYIWINLCLILKN